MAECRPVPMEAILKPPPEGRLRRSSLIELRESERVIPPDLKGAKKKKKCGANQT